MYGLEQGTIDKICQAMSKIINIEAATLFGSRAMGNYKHGSDIDICLHGDTLTNQDLLDLEELLFELYLPYSFDIINYNHLTHSELIAHIKTEGKSLYQRTAQKKQL